jgi:hypothetical protein
MPAGLHRVKVFFFASAPPPAFKRVSCCRHNAMYMRVKTQVLSPGVKHCNSHGFSTVVAVPKAVQGDNIQPIFQQVGGPAKVG